MTTPIDTTRLREACVDVEAAAAAVAAAEKARDNAKPRAKERAQVALFRADDNLTRAAFVLAENRASILALLDEVERLRARPTWERVLRIANGCTDYGGGHHGADHEVYQHGIWTVCNVLKNACEQGDKPDMQLRVVEAIGAEALTPGEPEEGGTR